LTDLFLILLATGWLVALGPAAVRARRRTPWFTSQGWRRRMQLIAPRRTVSSGRWVVAPSSSGALDRSARRSRRVRQERRKRALLLIVALVPVSLVAALLRGDWAWSLHAASYALLAVYIAFLAEDRHRRQEGVAKVRALRVRRRERAPMARRYEERRA
jgi:hypothetical protein